MTTTLGGTDAAVDLNADPMVILSVQDNTAENASTVAEPKAVSIQDAQVEDMTEGTEKQSQQQEDNAAPENDPAADTGDADKNDSEAPPQKEVYTLPPVSDEVMSTDEDKDTTTLTSFDGRVCAVVVSLYALAYRQVVNPALLQRREQWGWLVAAVTVLPVALIPRLVRLDTTAAGIVFCVAASAIYLDAASYMDATLQNALFFVIPTLLNRPRDEPWPQAFGWGIAFRLVADLVHDAAAFQ